MSNQAKAYVGFVAAVGLFAFGDGVAQWQPQDPLRLVCYLAIALAGATFKVHLPAITGTMSVNFLFILIGVLDFSLSETLVVGCAATLVQCLWHSRTRVMPIQLLFNFCSIALAITVADRAYHTAIFHPAYMAGPLRLGAAAISFFVMNTLPVSVIVAMTEGKKILTVWRNCYFWSFPYYLVGASIAACVSWLSGMFGWQVMVLVAPSVYIIFRSFGLYLGRLEEESAHAKQVADLHMRSIESLALAIDAKDRTTHDHLQRVQVYAVELAKELQLSEAEIQAVRAAALLHDIGKLAVPEHIISKPGKLTPEEFEKMKIHPVVGAEIIERAKYPYPVVPIVRAHHEKWNGKGYPFGLKGEEIPIGARILSVVDCLDALASHRQYRPALPLDAALKIVVSESGTSFDPRVVKVLQTRFRELERMAQGESPELMSLCTDTGVEVKRGSAPGAGFEGSPNDQPSIAAGLPVDFLSSIGAARQEVQTLFELSQDLGNSLSLSETLSVLDVRLRRMIPFDTMAVRVLRDGKLVPEYVAGEDSRCFAAVEFPVGQGLSGWVAENRKPIFNGDPRMEPGCSTDLSRICALHSALAVPLEGSDGVLGVLTLYRQAPDAFTRDHLRILEAISPKVALAIENSLKYRQAETSATTDYLTGLANSRSLFVQLDAELTRARRAGTSLTVLVCDLDGFKQVNDRFGHLVGDKVLRTFASALRACVREYDHVARMGGDEFVLILPGIQLESVPPKIQQIGAAARQAALEVCGEDIVGLSVGTACAPSDGWAAEDLLAQADRRMYRIKQEHRGQQQSLALASVAALQPEKLLVG